MVPIHAILGIEVLNIEYFIQNPRLNPIITNFYQLSRFLTFFVSYLLFEYYFPKSFKTELFIRPKLKKRGYSD